ncbi:hypothetical protein [Microbacterium sp. C7(2022)]|uniref:hypothetical protein n=1 Tax=Microbacterium sp. C7(2022) TaxID=2992759 RepID=UPI00237A582B|nr:hypothetical protein [Microbacterium sp. C7(2022)]MDE0546455.1 hypothetical protein [Microbacterium sp. C7(2022)]
MKSLVKSSARSLGDSRSVAHGVTTSAATAALTLIDPRRLSVRGRAVYRVGVAALTGWMLWASLRDESGLITTGARAGLTAASVGGVLGLAEAGEAMDARLQDAVGAAGARRPRVWMAAAAGVIGVLTWWAGRRMPESPFVPIEDFLDSREEEVPAQVHALVERLLSGTEDFGAAELRAQLAVARVTVSPMMDDFSGEAYFAVPDGLPRAVPGSGDFVVSGRFRALDDRTFDLTLSLSEGALSMLSVSTGSDWDDEDTEAWYSADRSPADLGSWPDAADVTLLMETPAGRREL